MANVSIVKVKVRRGTDAQRQQIILDQGELGFTIDSGRLFVGDGSTVGGICPAIKFYTINSISQSFINQTCQYVQLNDIVYDTNTTCFYYLSSTPGTNFANYAILPILTQYNARTILPTVSGGLSTGSLWINTSVLPNTLSVI